MKRRAMNSPRIIYTPRPGTTPESELNVLACVYRFVLERHAVRTAAAQGFRVRLEGGVDETVTKEPDEDVISSPVARTQGSEFPREK